MTRLTNSWMRRVNFISVSEANSITSSANVSAYDIKIDGNRGHAAIRSQGSSRVFIGKVTDRTNGPLIDNRGVIQQGGRTISCLRSLKTEYGCCHLAGTLGIGCLL